jgi:tetratricopeptide (TPR) repeat protein
MRAYSTREVADLIGDSQQRVRSAARAGFVSPLKDFRGHFRFSFQDVVLLRSTKRLEEQNPGVRRMWRALRAIRAHLPDERPLCSVRVIAANDRFLVRDNNTSWEPESGQTLFDFATPDRPAAAHAAGGHGESTSLVAADTSDYWFERGLKLDRAELHDEAARAYEQAIGLDPDHISARINLGRILHTLQNYDGAEALYREALRREPDHAIAAFNLGVVLEDRGTIDAAIESYQLAIDADPALPDAHFNLARLYEWRGDHALAARHMAQFRSLCRDDS